MSSINRGKRHPNVYPHKWMPGCNSEVRYWHLINSSEPARLILPAWMLIFFLPFAPVVSVVSIKVLGSAGGQTERGILCVAAGSRGTTLQCLPSHHILKSFSSQVLGSFTNSCCFIRAKLAHVRWTALWISIFNTVLFDCLNAGKKNDCFHSFLCLSNQASQVCCKILTILGLGSRVEHCFIHPLWILVKTTFLFCFGVGFFSLCLTKPGEYSAELYLFSVLLYSTCSQTETQLAENNPLQHYYLSPAVIAAMSFSMIVYQAAYLCRHDNSVNNCWVLSFGWDVR